MSSPSDDAPRPESVATAPDGPKAQTTPDDELPDWEPLTPELVEDEAIRGDAMLRHSVLLLAVLLSWTQIADTSLLVRLASGAFMVENGFLPPKTDPFSVSAEGRQWINLGWLADHALGAVYRAGGMLGQNFYLAGKSLTLWAVMLGLLTFWILSRITLARIPTWWNSIAAALALIAVFPTLTAGPVSITLLGASLLMWLLHRADDATKAPSLLLFGALFLFWSNLDALAWVGLALIWGAGIGRFLTTGERLGAASGDRTFLLKAAGVATVAALIHPFHWHVLESPLVLFQSELPEARAYGSIGPHFRWMLFPANDPAFWSTLEWPVGAGVLLAFLTLVTLLLNSSRVPLTHVALFVVANGLAFSAGLLLPAASIVNAVLASLNGQAWYSRTFRQTYSVAWSELAFSRAGRAITVLGLFTLAYLMINGALPGVAGRRLGLGFDWRIRTAIESYATLAANTDDPKAFNGRPDHGDLMIWSGMRPFNDSRLALFSRGGENLLKLHRDVFRALQVVQENVPGTGKPELWKEVLDRYQLKHIYARLTGDDGFAKYSLLQRLMLNPELKLAAVDAAAARLDRADAQAGTPPPAAPQVGIDFIQLAFRGEDVPFTEVPGWPRELTTYERWLIQPEPAIPLEGQLSQHYSYLANELASRLPATSKPGETAHALRILAIRMTQRSLVQDPNTPQVHRVLRDVYRAILGGEQSFGQFGNLNELRVRQLLAAEYFSLLTSAALPADHEQLAYALAAVGYRDVALEHLQAVYRQTGSWTSLGRNHPNFNQARTENQTLLKQLETSVKEVQANANREIQRGEDPIAVARAAFDAGCPRFALTILEPLEPQIVQDPMASMLHAQVLMAVGRIEECWERLEGIESLFPPDVRSAPGVNDIKSIWRSQTAIANMIRGDVNRAVDLWTDEARQLSESSVRGALDNVPLAAALPPRQDLLAFVGGRVAAEVLFTFPERWGSVQMLLAVSEIEHGQLSEARSAVKRIFDVAPRASIRPLAAYYYGILTGETVSPQPPAPEVGDDQPMYQENGERATAVAPDKPPMPVEPGAPMGAPSADEATSPPAPPVATMPPDGM
ncbi:hypothetical protein Pan44_35000 [Caulifigura coniformis]|uniref:Uncharacterized protein n=1 Tax=Caulifigura coniformis TaxID=2527983 RepID=A0A517SH92_9PLAN|nr:hypothetical protein [Caulifigura coniformis]QDT55457.1 hypothetical protein Pan44_35000 [Caulifigura coniformis]